MRSKYRCSSAGPVNNGLKDHCEFEYVFEDGAYHCPLCASPMTRIPDGKTVSELLSEGANKHRK